MTLTASFEKLFLSSLRLSSAATLYGVYQFENAVSIFQEPGGIGKQMDRFGTTVDSLAQCLVDGISPGKKDALNSISDITGKVVRQSIEGMSLFDPRQAFRIATNLAQRSGVTLADWGKSAGGDGTSPSSRVGEPRLAADVLVN
jgi:hypothetical protein